IKSDFDGLRPDIALICEKLVLFAEIWSSVRSQTVQFQETLEGGMDALTNIVCRRRGPWVDSLDISSLFFRA
ncbi:hypothetical protein DFP72DRAFT_826182, partial [Ephemerocybe angulata]